jgi:hypothetical protein
LAEIPVEVFQQVMNDVLCAFLIHKANVNGVQSAAMNVGKDESHHFESAKYVSGLEKVLAPLVLVHLRDTECELQ